MTDPKISIIVPVYEAEKSICKCIDSILNQTFNDFEVLLINDGSTDQSGDICDEYTKAHSNIHAFHQENGGPSAARNKGIDEAKGKYIVFIDSDDYVEKKFLESFFIKEKNPTNTLVQQGYVNENKYGEKEYRGWPSKIFHQSQFSELFLNTKFIKRLQLICGKLYELKIIKEQHIKFHSDIKFGEDLIFLLDYLHYIDSFILINKSYYHYKYNGKSLSRSYQEYEQGIKRFELVKKRLDSLSEKFNLSQELQDYNDSYIGTYLIRSLKGLYTEPNKKSFKERLQIIKMFENDFGYFIRNKFDPEGKFNNIFLMLFKRRLFYLLDIFMYFGLKYIKWK
jgi:glycosyltransferase EpsJ